MIRILHVIGSMNCGGAENLIINLYRKIDRTKIQFDFVLHTTDDCFFENEIISLGGKIFRTEKYVIKNHFSYKNWWKNFLQEHAEYQIIHGHINSSAAIYLKEAKRQKRYTLMHSHTSNSGGGLKGILKDIVQYPFRFYTDQCIGCSYEAAKWLYGKKIASEEKTLIVKNGIDAAHFRFDPLAKERVKDELNAQGKIICIHVGRFVTEKNHAFLIDIFQIVHRKHPNAQLWLLGEGTEKEKIIQKVQACGLTKDVRFLGVQRDVAPYLHAANVFLFPSLHEGLPLTIVEAQAAGLPILASNAVPKEADVGAGLLHWMELSDELEKWADRAIALSACDHVDTYEQVLASGYDINSTVALLTKMYQQISENQEG